MRTVYQKPSLPLSVSQTLTQKVGSKWKTLWQKPTKTAEIEMGHVEAGHCVQPDYIASFREDKDSDSEP